MQRLQGSEVCGPNDNGAKAHATLQPLSRHSRSPFPGFRTFRIACSVIGRHKGAIRLGSICRERQVLGPVGRGLLRHLCKDLVSRVIVIGRAQTQTTRVVAPKVRAGEGVCVWCVCACGGGVGGLDASVEVPRSVRLRVCVCPACLTAQGDCIVLRIQLPRLRPTACRM